MINVRKYTVPKNLSNISSVSSSKIIQNSTVSNIVEKYDDSEIRQLIENLQDYLDGDEVTFKTLLAQIISASTSITSPIVNADTVNATDGNITNIIGDTLTYDSANIDDATIASLIAQGITTKDLTVTGKAHFFELIVDKIKAAGGSVLITPADGFKVDKVEGIYRDSGEIEDDDYIQLEYLDNGSNGVINLGYYPKNTTRIIADVLIPSTTTTDILFGCRQSSTVNTTNPAYVFWTYDTGGGTNQKSRFSYYSQSTYRGATVKLGERQTITTNGGQITYKAYNNNTVTIGTTATTEWVMNKPMALFGLYQGSAIYSNWKLSNAKLWRFTIYEGETLVRDYVPAYRISTQRYGLYDLVNSTFTTNTAFKGSTLYKQYKVYWKTTDGDKKIANMWKINDQAICQTFNAATGDNYNVSNKYYWSLVVNTGLETIDDIDYHYLTLSNEIVDGDLNPEVGDEIAMLGYRGNDDADRQSAIYIAAYNSIDTALNAPLYAQYKGINDFNLTNHKYTWFASNSNQIQGNLVMTNGETIEDAIDTIHVESVTDYWLASSLSTGITYDTIGWQTSPPDTTEVLKYLWHYQETLYSDGHSDKTTPSITGNYSRDGEDTYSVYVYSVNGNLTLLGSREVDLYAEVWKGSTNITSSVPQSAFSWERTSTDSDADAVWNATKVGVGRFLHLTDSDVIKKCVFDCIVNIDIVKDYL